MNRYSYVLNNPYKYVDPSGNNPFLVVIGGSATIGAVYGFIDSAFYSDNPTVSNVAVGTLAGAVGGAAGGATLVGVTVLTGGAALSPIALPLTLAAVSAESYAFSERTKELLGQPSEFGNLEHDLQSISKEYSRNIGIPIFGDLGLDKENSKLNDVKDIKKLIKDELYVDQIFTKPQEQENLKSSGRRSGSGGSGYFSSSYCQQTGHCYYQQEDEGDEEEGI